MHPIDPCFSSTPPTLSPQGSTHNPAAPLSSFNEMTNQRTIKLNDGNDASIYAYGTASTLFGEDAQAAVMMAITEAGVRHIDTAACYSNEDSVGRAIGLKRLHTFVTTKCDENVPPKRSLESSLKVLGFSHVDLFLIHSPMGFGLREAWRQMEMLQEDGKATSIGVSNFRISDLEESQKGAKVVPAVNQIEVHPYVYDKAKPLIDHCHSKGIQIATFSTIAPITHFPGGPVDVIVNRIAEELGITDDQVLVKWAHQVSYGGIVVTSSLRKDRLMGQMRALFEVEELSEAQVQEIAKAGMTKHQRVWEPYMDDE